MQTEERKKLSKIKRQNAKLFPIYKTFSWDLICFYPIQFLFFTITKGLTASQVLITNSCYIIFKIITQVLAVTITDSFGKRKSIILGNSLLIVYMIILILSPNIFWIIIAEFFCALAYTIKTISETNLLYDSVSTKGGEGLYSKLESKGGSGYYWLDGIMGISAGYLFVINNYLPMFICLGFTIISTILSLGFRDIYEVKQKESLNKVIKDYSKDLRTSVKFILKSNRLKSYIIFGAIFYGLITIIDTYRSELLVSIGIPEEQFSMIFAVLTLLAAITVNLSAKIHKKFKNKTLSFLSLSYVGACIIISIFANAYNRLSIPIILIMYVVLKVTSSIWYVLKYKYLNNFTSEDMRNKITFTYELIGSIIASIISLIGSVILDKFGINNAFILVSLAALIGIILALDYMRPRFGLKPSQYKKEDIEIKV